MIFDMRRHASHKVVPAFRLSTIPFMETEKSPGRESRTRAEVKTSCALFFNYISAVRPRQGSMGEYNPGNHRPPERQGAIAGLKPVRLGRLSSIEKSRTGHNYHAHRKISGTFWPR
jgi:hypothetical protein